MAERAEEPGRGESDAPPEQPEPGPGGEPASPSPESEDDRNLLLAGLGALSLTREKIESVIDDLARRGSEQRSSDADAAAPPSGGQGIADRASSALAGLFHELGLVTDSTIDELELRVAQLEHRLRILERKAAEAEKTPPPTAQP